MILLYRHDTVTRNFEHENTIKHHRNFVQAVHGILRLMNHEAPHGLSVVETLTVQN